MSFEDEFDEIERLRAEVESLRRELRQADASAGKAFAEIQRLEKTLAAVRKWAEDKGDADSWYLAAKRDVEAILEGKQP